MAKLASTTVYGNLNVLETINAVNELQINNGEILTANIEAFKYKNKQVVTVDGAANTTFDINVASATKLKTARTINGTNFDGTGNITTANWGTARTLTIGSTGKSVNGSANVSWSLAELGLGNVNNTADSAKNVLSATKLTTARTIGGVSFDGTANINLPGVNTAGNQNTTGNANSATILQNTRTINGTNFNGSANITTSNWGTARNIQIGNTAKSVNGSGNISWSLSEIGSFASKWNPQDILEGSYFGQIISSNTIGAPNSGSQAFILKGSTAESGNGGYKGALVWGYTNGIFSLGQSGPDNIWKWNKIYHDGYKPLADAATKLQTARTIGGVSFDGTANINLPGVNTAGNQSTSGNAATATKLQTTRAINGTNFDGTAAITTAHWGTARNLQIGNTAKSVNGSSNVTWSLAEIGALSKTGDTIQGKLALSHPGSASIDPNLYGFNVFGSSGGVQYGMNLLSPGGDNNWGTNIYGPNQGNRFIYFSKINTASPNSNASFSVKSKIDLDSGEMYLVDGTKRVYHAGNKPSSSDVGLGNVPNTVHTTAATANTVAVRDSAGDINVRLLRPNYADQSTISGAMAFRINNGSDNFIRFCNNVTNIRNWLGAAASSHNHDASNITAGTLAVARGGTGTTSSTGSGSNVLNTSPTFSGTITHGGMIQFSNSGTAFRGLQGTMGDNDHWRIGGAATATNAGYLEIATCDDNSEPIYVRQYTGVFSTLNRTATLLDASGNTSFPGTVTGSKVYNAVWNDYAEYFPKLETTITEAGDIIALSLNDDDEFYELATEDHVMIVGAHSDQYGHLIGGENPPEEFKGDFTEWNDSKFIPVGLVGRLPVKFIGEAKKGMKVVPSHIPGVGRKFDSTKDDYDKVIGYIVENNNEEGIRRVKIKIGK